MEFSPVFKVTIYNFEMDNLTTNTEFFFGGIEIRTPYHDYLMSFK